MKLPPEQINVEYKTASGGKLQNNIWQTISAFSNSEGGQIYFGVRPDGSKENLSNSDLDKLQVDLISLAKDSFNVPIIPDLVVKEGVLLAIFGPTQPQLRPIYRKKNGIKDGTFVRQGSSNIKADGEIIQRLTMAARGGAEAIEYDEDYKKVLDSQKIAEYIKLLNNRNDNVYQKFSREEVLIKQKIISKDAKKITLFGLLVFSSVRDLQDIVAPTVNIAVTQYSGINKINEDNLDETYRDNKEFNGCVVDQFNNAFNYIKSRVPVKGIINNGKRTDVMVIPEIAIRESLANAIAHRDYSTFTSRIQVDIYSDRIEIHNPGNSLVPIKELDSAPSTSRNPLLMSSLKEYGITDQKARGIRTIVSAIKDSELIEPIFKDSSKSFSATLFSTSIFTQEDEKFIEKFKDAINQRQKRAIAYVRKHPEGISNGVYRDINNIQMVRDDKKANKELNELVKMKILKPTGNGKGRRYHLAKK